MPARHFHLSVDDVSDCVKYLCRDNPPQRHPTQNPSHPADGIHGLLDLVSRYKVKTDLYFYLDDVACCLPAENPDAAYLDFFRFGPHAENHATPPHTLSAQERDHFLQTGFARVDELFGQSRRASWLRLHYFSEPLENHQRLRAEGVTHILLTDKPALAYRLGDQARTILAKTGQYHNDNITYVSSHMRLEAMLSAFPTQQQLDYYLDSLIDTRDTIVLFTHEQELKDKHVIGIAEYCICYLLEKNICPL